MRLVIGLCLVALITTGYCREITEEDLYNAKPGHLEYDPEFRKMYPNIPGPPNDVEPFIVGGEESVPNSRPYQAALYRPTAGGTSFCGATLINARTALTAAHCVDNRVGNITLIFGAHTMPPTNEPHAISVSSDDVVIHPGWASPVLVHDIALVRLSEPLTLNANITPALLPRDDSQDYLGNTTLVSGWGRPSDSVNTISPVLREVTSYVVSNYACRLAYLGLLDESHICISGGGGVGTCNGDSGGPLTVNGVVIGVVSFVSSWGCEQGWPPGFARVTYYLDWIHENMAT